MVRINREEFELAAVTALPNDSRMGLTAEIKLTKSRLLLLLLLLFDDEDDESDNDEANC